MSNEAPSAEQRAMREAFDKAGYWPNEVLWKVWRQAWAASLAFARSATEASAGSERAVVCACGAPANYCKDCADGDVIAVAEKCERIAAEEMQRAYPNVDRVWKRISQLAATLPEAHSRLVPITHKAVHDAMLAVGCAKDKHEQ